MKTAMGYYCCIMQGDFAQDTKDAFARINLRVQQKRKRN